MTVFSERPSEAIGYKEAIRHPALSQALFAKGTLTRRHDGALIRHQSFPTEEIITIEAQSITVARPTEDYRNVLPVSTHDLPAIGVLRQLLDGQISALRENNRTIFLSDINGWSVTLTPKTGGAGVTQTVITGCANTARTFTVHLSTGESRILTFVDP